MIKATIVCDASWNRELCLGGYSGGILIENDGKEWVEIYNGVYPECYSSNHGEMRAIAMGMDKVHSIAKKLGVTVDNVAVHTDSKVSIKQLSLFDNNKQHKHIYTQELTLLSKNIDALNLDADKLSITHVKAHVEDYKASPIEALHNMVDKNATTARWTTQNHHIDPQNKRSKFYGVLLNPNMPLSHRHEIRKAGYHQASKGMRARIAFPGSKKALDNHPFMQGIAQYASEQGKSPEDFYKLYRYDRKGGLMNGAEGLDRTLVRAHFQDKGKDSFYLKFDHTSYYNAAVATRLMFGNQYPRKQNSNIMSGRLESPSAYVLNFFGSQMKGDKPTYINEWVNRFSEIVPNIKVANGLKQVVGEIKLDESLEISDPEAPMISAIESALSYMGELEVEQVALKLSDNLKGLGLELSDSELLDTLNVALSSPKKKVFGTVVHKVFEAKSEADKNKPTLNTGSRKEDLSQNIKLSLSL